MLISRRGAVGVANNASGTTVSVTLPGPPQAGDGMLAQVRWVNTAASLSSVTAGWTQIGSTVVTTSLSVAYYRRTAVAGDTTFVATFSAANKCGVEVWVGAGVDTSSIVDASATASGTTGTTHTTPTATATDAGDWLVSFVADKGATPTTTWSISAGAVRASDFTTGAGGTTGAVADAGASVGSTGVKGGLTFTSDQSSSAYVTATFLVKAAPVAAASVQVARARLLAGAGASVQVARARLLVGGVSRVQVARARLVANQATAAVYPFRSGAFYDPGAFGSLVAGVRAFGTARGRPCDVAHDYPAKASWAQMASLINSLDGTEFADNYMACLSIPPIPNDGVTTLASVASGAHDADIDAIGNAIATQFPTGKIIWRYWEPNVNALWFAATGTSGGRPGSVADWNACLLREMQRIHAIVPNLRFSITPSRGYRSPTSGFACYPGDAAKAFGLYYWGFDGYDFWYNHPSVTPEQRFANYMNDDANPNNREGAIQHAQFAAAHGLVLMVGEWASANPDWQANGAGGDDPYFATHWYTDFAIPYLGPEGIELAFMQDIGAPTNAFHKMATIGTDVPVYPKPNMWAVYQQLWPQKVAGAAPSVQVARARLVVGPTGRPVVQQYAPGGLVAVSLREYANGVVG